MRKILSLAAGLLALATALHGAAAVRQVTIAPAPVERAAQVVTLTLPRELAAGATLRDDRGQIVPLQVESDLTARFIVVRQAANQSLTFRLEPGRQPDQGNVQVVEEPSPPRPGTTPGIASATAPSRLQAKAGRLRVSVGGRPILYYQMDPDAMPRENIDPSFRRAGYLHPVLTPNGAAVTDDYPIRDPGQHGISSTQPTVEGAPARFEFGGVDNTWTGPVHGGFTSLLRWIEPQGANATVVASETWELTAYALPKEAGEFNLFDLDITETATPPPGGSMQFLPMLRLGVPASWIRPDWSQLIRSGPKGGELLPLHWVAMTGIVKNEPAGVAVLIRSAGKPGAGITPGIGNAGSQSISIFPGETDLLPTAPPPRSLFHFRIVTFDGPPDNALLEALWNGYTVPAVVTIAGP